MVWNYNSRGTRGRTVLFHNFYKWTISEISKSQSDPCEIDVFKKAITKSSQALQLMSLDPKLDVGISDPTPFKNYPLKNQQLSILIKKNSPTNNNYRR